MAQGVNRHIYRSAAAIPEENAPPHRSKSTLPSSDEASDRLGLAEFEVKVGFEWNKTERLQIWTTDGFGLSHSGSSIPLAQYTPVEVTVRADAEATVFFQQVHDLALDCVNQGGIATVQTISPSRA